MPKPTKGGFYAVSRGRTTGVFMTWEECGAQIKGYNGAIFKKFSTAAAAEEFVDGSTSNAILATSSKATTTDVKGKKRARSSDVEDESEWDVVYCDGACKGNGQPGSVAGLGVWWGKKDPRNIAERCPGGQTNNRAELIAILRVLETTPVTKKSLLIKSDSQYSINCFKIWLRNWRSNDFRVAGGGPVKNAALIRYIAANLDARAIKSQKVRLQHVKGHNGEEGNEGADELANRGAMFPALPERDWEELQRILEAKSGLDAHTVTVVPKEVGKDEVEFEAEASNVKTANLQKAAIKSPPRKTVKGNSANTVVKASPKSASKRSSKKRLPKVVVHADEVDFDTYADGKMWDDGPVPAMKQAKTVQTPNVDIPKSNEMTAEVDDDMDLDMYADGLMSDDELRKLTF